MATWQDLANDWQKQQTDAQKQQWANQYYANNPNAGANIQPPQLLSNAVKAVPALASIGQATNAVTQAVSNANTPAVSNAVLSTFAKPQQANQGYQNNGQKAGVFDSSATQPVSATTPSVQAFPSLAGSKNNGIPSLGTATAMADMTKPPTLQEQLMQTVNTQAAQMNQPPRLGLERRPEDGLIYGANDPNSMNNQSDNYKLARLASIANEYHPSVANTMMSVLGHSWAQDAQGKQQELPSLLNAAQAFIQPNAEHDYRKQYIPVENKSYENGLPVSSEQRLFDAKSQQFVGQSRANNQAVLTPAQKMQRLINISNSLATKQDGSPFSAEERQRAAQELAAMKTQYRV